MGWIILGIGIVIGVAASCIGFGLLLAGARPRPVREYQDLPQRNPLDSLGVE